jgi:hypothetical protein
MVLARLSVGVNATKIAHALLKSFKTRLSPRPPARDSRRTLPSIDLAQKFSRCGPMISTTIIAAAANSTNLPNLPQNRTVRPHKAHSAT